MVVSSTDMTSRLAANASHKINRNIITAINEISEPIEETVFHRAYASG